MNTIFSKKYSGKIKRMISEGQACPSSLPELYIKKSKNIKIDESNTEGLYPAKIFNIVNKKDTVEITTNTLGILITDKVFNDVVYFKKLNKLPKNLESLKQISNEFYVDGETVYLNTDQTYIQLDNEIYTVIPVLGLQLWDKDPTISIRRLKDRFKITVKTKKTLQIQLSSPSILTPTIHNQWVTFSDCVHTFGTDSFLYLYTHSFEYYDKIEIHDKTLKINLRDIPIGDVVIEDFMESYYKVSYRTFRSNMQLNNELGTDLYINITVDKNLVTLTAQQFTEKMDYLIKVSKEKTKIDEAVINPYLLTPLYKSKPEVFYFTWDTVSKYSTSLNTPLGCERIQLDLSKLLSRKVNTVELDDRVIQENNYYTSNSEINTSEYSGNKTQLDELLSILNSNKADK